MHETEPLYYTTPIPRQWWQKKRNLLAMVALAALLVFVALWLYTTSVNKPTASFPVGTEITIEEGSTTRDIAEMLKEQGIIRSTLYFQVVLARNFNNSFVQAGSYVFPRPLTSKEVAEALTAGEYLVPPVKITFPEGFRVANMHEYLPERYGEEDVTSFIQYEGTLFPDTYFVEEDASLEEIIALMQAHFETKIEVFRDQIDASELTKAEVLILASILEREGNDEVSMRTIAGILFNRIEIDMALQVDATFEYILGKTSAELTTEDLAIDSPYNTYTNRGLPPTPIANPGIVAIAAVLNPIESEYLYYLTGNDGNFYYAETFEEHKLNKALYLR